MDVSPATVSDFPSTPDNLVEVGVYPHADAAFEHSLVILAMRRECWLVPFASGHRLMVEPVEVDAVLRQLRCFDRESVGWPPVPVEAVTPPRPIHLTTPLLWALTIIVVFWIEAANPGWIERGALDRDAIFLRHEWWRTFSALFLHADTGHLVSNLVSGVFVFSIVLGTFGLRRGWLLLAASSVLGNAFVVTLNHDTIYRSIGASTAVFAAVGLLTGAALRRLRSLRTPFRWRAMLVPVVSGLTVLALYGAGGVHIDIGAHCAGFAAGFVAGLLVPSRTEAPSAATPSNRR